MDFSWLLTPAVFCEHRYFENGHEMPWGRGPKHTFNGICKGFCAPSFSKLYFFWEELLLSFIVNFSVPWSCNYMNHKQTYQLMYQEKCTVYQHICHFMYMNQKEAFVATRCWCSQTLVFLFVHLIFWPWSCQGPPSTQGLLNFTRDPFGPGNRWHVSTLSTCSLHAAYMFYLATFTNAGDSDQLREYDVGLSGMSRVLVSFASGASTF